MTAVDARMHGQHPQATLQLPKAIMLTNPDSESLLLEHTHPVVATVLLLQHHGVLGWQLGAFAHPCCCAVAASPPCANATTQSKCLLGQVT